MRCHLDFETTSTCDLRRAGAWVYASHPDTRVIVLAYAFDNEPVFTWIPGQSFPVRLWQHVKNGGEIHAWNANFEIAIWNYTLSREALVPTLTPEQCFCTMAAGAYWGLPLSLDQAAQALQLPHQKDKAGHALMLRMARPRRFEKDGTPVFWHEEDKARYQQLCDYCCDDVRAERGVFNAIPELPPRERQIWLCDHRMNRRGIQIDETLIDKLNEIINEETERLDDDIFDLTQGDVANTRAVASIIKFVNAWGAGTQSIDKAHMKALLDNPRLHPLAIQALLLRQEAAKTSTAKLKSMKNASGQDGRVRGLMQYYGAFRTGRWAGRLCQIQNYPRIPKGFPLAWAVRSVLDEDDDADAIRLKFGSPMSLASTLLRQCFVAKPGHVLVSADFAQVEARVSAWLAGQWDILDIFAKGEDVYTYAAAQIGSSNRQLGKVVTLALGFGMGADKFEDTAASYGINIDNHEARLIVWAWRGANTRIVNCWYALDDTARAVIGNGHDTHWVDVRGTSGKLSLRMAKWGSVMHGALLMRLPSGRTLCYRDATIDDGSIEYSGLDQYTRQWKRIRTYGGKLFENAVQGTARDLMADFMTEAEKTFFTDDLVASIHDEAVFEVLDTPKDIKAVKDILTALVGAASPWANKLPLAGDIQVGRRYGKA